jgi:ribosomal protein S18 acetylase RimI-like enzyme
VPEAYQIRRATAADVQPIIDLATEMVLHSVSPFRPVTAEQVKQYRREDLQTLNDILELEHSGVFIAEATGKLLGHIIVVAHQRDSSTGTTQAWIYDVSVVPGSWGQGVGQALMREAEQFARQQGMSAIGLGVTLNNTRALDFYMRLGYAQERVQMLKSLD